LANEASGEAEASDNEDFTCDVLWANDLHITYYSDTTMTIESTVNGGFPYFSSSTPDNGVTWECAWSGKTVHYGETVHVGVTFEQATENWLEKKDIYWTQNGDRVGDELPGPGFKVEPPTGDVSVVNYTLINSTNVAFTVNALQFRISEQECPLESMVYPVDGFDPCLPEAITLQPTDTYTVELEPNMSPPYYVMAQGSVQASEEVGHFVHQHEHPESPVIPTVSQWGLIVMAGLVLVAGAVVIVWRKRRLAV
jgi:hypothetical protein